MSLKLYAMTCGRLTTDLGGLIEGGKGDITVPVPSFLIEHPKGTLLFDTGLHLGCQHDPASHVAAKIAQHFRFQFGEGEEVSGRLAAIGQEADRIDFIVNSHLHFDHAGGNALIPNATVVVQRREWQAGMDPDMAAALLFDSRDYDLGHKVKLVDGEHDLFGDGSVVLLPTPGHTPGHQSLKLRLASGEVVLASDACYLCRNLQEQRLPPSAWNREQALQSLGRLARLEAGGARIFYGHDPQFWESVKQAPEPIL